VAVLVLVLAAGGVYYLRSSNTSPPPAPASPVDLAPAAEPAIAHPLPAGADNSAAASALPALADSDTPLRDALAKVSSAEAVKNYLLPENLIRRLVVSIDNLPRQKVAVERRPTTAIAGSLVADGDELHATLDRQNFDRYKPLVAVINKLDMQQARNPYRGAAQALATIEFAITSTLWFATNDS
jgi:hypothetical protein